MPLSLLGPRYGDLVYGTGVSAGSSRASGCAAPISFESRYVCVCRPDARIAYLCMYLTPKTKQRPKMLSWWFCGDLFSLISQKGLEKIFSVVDSSCIPGTRFHESTTRYNTFKYLRSCILVCACFNLILMVGKRNETSSRPGSQDEPPVSRPTSVVSHKPKIVQRTRNDHKMRSSCCLSSCAVKPFVTAVRFLGQEPLKL